MSALRNRVYRFGDFELEPAERRLLDAGKPIALAPKVFDTLVLLVERAGHVVSKDELLRVLWPRGYVDESNLTKHIWLIRRALGDGENGSRFIETVPKLGYRFVATTITNSASSAPGLPAASATAPASQPEPAPDSSSELAAGPPAAQTPGAGRRFWGPSAGLAVAVLAVAIVWRFASAPGVRIPVTPPGHTVALVGFNNLSGNAKDVWLSPALTEMLGTELSVAENLRVVPDELVRNARMDLAPPAAGGYAPATLARLRQRLGADYVVSGSYLVSGSSEDSSLRVDIALQDARDGSMVVSVSNEGAASGLIALVTKAGNSLRGKLGIKPAAEALGLVAATQPPSVDVARRIGFALDALHNYDPARARDELLEAIAEAPDYTPAYTLLAQAWSALGYRDKALAAAEQAARSAATLSPEQRLQTEAVVESARAEWGKAAAAWQALVRLRPLDPEYHLRWIDTLIAGGAAAGAQGALRDLQRLPEMSGDPRVELAASRIAGALDDAKGSAQHASNALREARQRDAVGLLADAKVALAGARLHLNQNEEARAGLTEAIGDYRSIRNPRGEAAARRNLALALSNLNRAQDAREEYQRALALEQSIGDVGGAAGVYRDLCSMLWVRGDRDGAQVAARHSLELARETGDLYLQSWTLRALATIASDDAASNEVLNDYREVIALNERSGDRGGHAWSLASYADVERMRGNLGEAGAICARAYTEALTLSDPQFAVYSQFTCALIDVDQGNAEAARAALQEVERRVGSGGDTTYLNDTRITLAQLDMDEGHWSTAQQQLREASRGFAAADVQTGEADAQALLALCAQALGDGAAREAAASRARKLRQSITSKQEVYVVDIALARLDGRTQTDSAATDKLLALAADAERRHWVGWSLEAKVAAWELLQARGAPAAERLRGEIQVSARRHGFGRILKLSRQPDTTRPVRTLGEHPHRQSPGALAASQE